MSGAPYGNQWDGEEQVYNVDLSAEELHFQTFEATQPGAPNIYPGEQLYGGNPYLNPGNEPYKGGIFTPSPDVSKDYDGSNNFDDEPPLLEELGINIEHILQKTLSVLNPFRSTDPAILQDADLAGPLVFCVAFGGFLLLAGKVHFNYIYGIALFGCASMYALLTLMATCAVTFGTVTSVLGYCLLPMVLLSGVNVLTSLQGVVGIVLTLLSIAWCSLSASKLFVAALSMDQQQPLVAYPCALLYGVFALITIF